jgi:hypothetical protein
MPVWCALFLRGAQAGLDFADAMQANDQRYNESCGICWAIGRAGVSLLQRLGHQWQEQTGICYLW